MRCDPVTRRFVGTTENVLALTISTLPLGFGNAPVSVEIDGTVLHGVEVAGSAVLPIWGGGVRARLVRLADGRWVSQVRGDERRELRRRLDPYRGYEPYGPFKDAFQNRFSLVYGTTGTPDENAWAYTKARLDAETWYYRGNGSIDVRSDTEWIANPDGGPRERPRNVILYGNADTNGAWAHLVHLDGRPEAPVDVRRGFARIGTRRVDGADVAVLFFRPAPGGRGVAVVSGTGLPGMRLCDRVPYFTSGVHLPDVTVLRVDALEKGVEGVRVAGFFGLDWSVEAGEFAWRD
jgi:hypothetical protein